MTRTLFIILVVCTLSAMTAVPRLRRAMNPEEEENETPSFKSTRGTSIICAPQTPCAWYIYNAYSKVISSNITNSYCVCGPGTTCEISENDETGNTYIYRCRETPES